MSSSALTRVPSSVTTFPFTLITPASINSSASLREQIPEFAMKRFKRTPSVCVVNDSVVWGLSALGLYSFFMYGRFSLESNLDAGLSEYLFSEGLENPSALAFLFFEKLLFSL